MKLFLPIPRYNHICRSCSARLARYHESLPAPQSRRYQATHDIPSEEAELKVGRRRLRLSKHTTRPDSHYMLSWTSRNARETPVELEAVERTAELREAKARRNARQSRGKGQERVKSKEKNGGGAKSEDTAAEKSCVKEEMVRKPGEVRRALRRSRVSCVESSNELTPSPPSAPLGIAKAPKPRQSLEIPTEPSTTYDTYRSTLTSYNWYWETVPPTPSQRSSADKFFTDNARTARWLRAFSNFRSLPESDVPEVAFVGRSNVGKSSLLNALFDIEAQLARTSATPGHTKTINMFGIGPGSGVQLTRNTEGHSHISGKGGLVVVDMPGYGSGSLAEWGVEIMKYLQGRRQLRRVFVLLDPEHGIKDKDRALLASLRLAGTPHQILLSKIDKLYIPKVTSLHALTQTNSGGRTRMRTEPVKPRGEIKDVREHMEKIRHEIQPPAGGGALGELLAVSTRIVVDGRRLGVDEVRWSVLKAAGVALPVQRVHARGRGEGGVRYHSGNVQKRI